MLNLVFVKSENRKFNFHRCKNFMVYSSWLIMLWGWSFTADAHLLFTYGIYQNELSNRKANIPCYDWTTSHRTLQYVTRGASIYCMKDLFGNMQQSNLLIMNLFIVNTLIERTISEVQLVSNLGYFVWPWLQWTIDTVNHFPWSPSGYIITRFNCNLLCFCKIRQELHEPKKCLNFQR